MQKISENSIVYSIEEIYKPQKLVHEAMKHCNVITFEGPLGAGKTTLIKKILKDSGVEDLITSPTYTYVNIYSNKLGQKFYHFDLYRISSIEEFFDLGFNEYLSEANSWSFIEWPEVIRPLLMQNFCEVKIDYFETDKRELKMVLISCL